MEYRHESRGWRTFLEHWGFALAGMLCLILIQSLLLLTHLKGAPWIYFSWVSLALMISGAAAILYAKIPVYRAGRFLTFGAKAVPPHLAEAYRWGWRLLSLGVVIGLCLWLAQP